MKREFITVAGFGARRARSVLKLEPKCKASAWAALIVAGLFASPAHGAAMIYNLGTLGGSISSGYAINDAGQIAGSSTVTGSTPYHAFRYDGTPGSGGVMRDLGTLAGGTDSESRGVNNAGQV